MLYQWLRRGGFVAKAFDSLIVAVLVVLMAFLLIPESWAQLGYWSIALILAGYLVPGLLEHLIKKAAHTFLDVFNDVFDVAEGTTDCSRVGRRIICHNHVLSENPSKCHPRHSAADALCIGRANQPQY